MAKDPATLWYWNDWHSGTILMSRFLKGCYIDLLHAQFNHGPLSLEEIKTCLGSDFGSSWPTIQKKFKYSDTGLYFNERLEDEKEKRKGFVDSRKNNGSKGGRPKDKPNGYPIGKPKNNLTEDEDENKDCIKYSIEECLEISLKDDRWIRNNKTTRQELEKFNQQLEGCGEYQKNPLEYKTHFYHLKRKRPDAIKPEAKQLTMDEWKLLARQQDKQTA